MSLKQVCDGPSCGKVTHMEDPMWITVIPPQIKAFGTSTEEKHFCSWTCVHAKSYLCISGDNGK